MWKDSYLNNPIHAPTFYDKILRKIDEYGKDQEFGFDFGMCSKKPSTRPCTRSSYDESGGRRGGQQQLQLVADAGDGGGNNNGNDNGDGGDDSNSVDTSWSYESDEGDGDINNDDDDESPDNEEEAEKIAFDIETFVLAFLDGFRGSAYSNLMLEEAREQSLKPRR